MSAIFVKMPAGDPERRRAEGLPDREADEARPRVLPGDEEEDAQHQEELHADEQHPDAHPRLERDGVDRQRPAREAGERRPRVREGVDPHAEPRDPVAPADPDEAEEEDDQDAHGLEPEQDAEVEDDDEPDEDLEDQDELALGHEIRLARLVDQLRDLPHRRVDGQVLDAPEDDEPEDEPQDAHDEPAEEERPPVHAHQLDRPDVGHPEAGLAARPREARRPPPPAPRSARAPGSAPPAGPARPRADREPAAAPRGGGRTNSTSRSCRGLLKRKDAVRVGRRPANSIAEPTLPGPGAGHGRRPLPGRGRRGYDEAVTDEARERRPERVARRATGRRVAGQSRAALLLAHVPADRPRALAGRDASGVPGAPLVASRLPSAPVGTRRRRMIDDLLRDPAGAAADAPPHGPRAAPGRHRPRGRARLGGRPPGRPDGAPRGAAHAQSAPAHRPAGRAGVRARRLRVGAARPGQRAEPPAARPRHGLCRRRRAALELRRRLRRPRSARPHQPARGARRSSPGRWRGCSATSTRSISASRSST